MPTIEKIYAREIIDSRGNPTVEAEVKINGGAFRAQVPSGASTGTKEALELRDGDIKRFGGKGVLNAIGNIKNVIAKNLEGNNFDSLQQFDAALIELDGTENKSKLGANAILGVSLAFAKAFAHHSQQSLYRSLNHGEKMTLPVPMMNILNGGAHADNNVDFQEFMIIPVAAQSMLEAVEHGTRVFHSLKAILKQQGLSTAVGDEGGFAPNLTSNEQAVELILEAITKADLTAGKDIYLGLDVASSEFYANGSYTLQSINKSYTAEELVDLYSSWVSQYPIISIEDGMAENDMLGWQLLTQELGSKLQLVGDDLFVTNTKIFAEGIKEKLANSILIKLNQIGTVSETLAAIKMAHKANYTAIISHRSGETEDTTIADLAVATGCGQIKTGAPCRGERVQKYNQLLRIEGENGFGYAGAAAFKALKLK